MKRCMRVISVAVAVIFMMSSVCADLTMARPFDFRPNCDKLATSGGFDDILGLSDLTRARITVERALLAGCGLEGTFNLEAFQRAAADSNELTGKTEEPLQLFGSEARELQNGSFRVVCKIRHRSAEPMKIHVIFTPNRDDQGKFPVEALTENQWAERGGDALLKSFRQVSENGADDESLQIEMPLSENGWLALGYTEGQSVIIGEDVSVTVLKIMGDSARLKIQAPDTVKVDFPGKREQRSAVKTGAIRGLVHTFKVRDVFTLAKGAEIAEVLLADRYEYYQGRRLEKPKVRIAIKAPGHVSVNRLEVYHSKVAVAEQLLTQIRYVLANLRKKLTPQTRFNEVSQAVSDNVRASGLSQFLASHQYLINETDPNIVDAEISRFPFVEMQRKVLRESFNATATIGKPIGAVSENGANDRAAGQADRNARYDELMKKRRSAHEVFKGSRDEKELLKMYERIVSAVEGISTKILAHRTAVSYKEDTNAAESSARHRARIETAVTRNDIGVIDAQSDGVPAVMITVGDDKAVRNISVERKFVEWLNMLRKLMADDASSSLWKAQNELIDRIVMEYVMHETGHHLCKVSGFDLASLHPRYDPAKGEEWNKKRRQEAKKLRRDFADVMGIKENDIPGIGDETELIRFADGMADLMVAGEGGRDLVRNKSAFFFFRYFIKNASKLVDSATGEINEYGIRKLVREYYFGDPDKGTRGNKYKRLVFKYALRRPLARGETYESAVDKLVADMGDQAVADFRLFFGKGTKWHDRYITRSRQAGDYEEGPVTGVQGPDRGVAGLSKEYGVLGASSENGTDDAKPEVPTKRPSAKVDARFVLEAISVSQLVGRRDFSAGEVKDACDSLCARLGIRPASINDIRRILNTRDDSLVNQGFISIENRNALPYRYMITTKGRARAMLAAAEIRARNEGDIKAKNLNPKILEEKIREIVSMRYDLDAGIIGFQTPKSVKERIGELENEMAYELCRIANVAALGRFLERLTAAQSTWRNIISTGPLMAPYYDYFIEQVRAQIERVEGIRAAKKTSSVKPAQSASATDGQQPEIPSEGTVTVVQGSGTVTAGSAPEAVLELIYDATVGREMSRAEQFETVHGIVSANFPALLSKLDSLRGLADEKTAHVIIQRVNRLTDDPAERLILRRAFLTDGEGSGNTPASDMQNRRMVSRNSSGDVPLVIGRRQAALIGRDNGVRIYDRELRPDESRRLVERTAEAAMNLDTKQLAALVKALPERLQQEAIGAVKKALFGGREYKFTAFLKALDEENVTLRLARAINLARSVDIHSKSKTIEKIAECLGSSKLVPVVFNDNRPVAPGTVIVVTTNPGTANMRRWIYVLYDEPDTRAFKFTSVNVPGYQPAVEPCTFAAVLKFFGNASIATITEEETDKLKDLLEELTSKEQEITQAEGQTETFLHSTIAELRQDAASEQGLSGEKGWSQHSQNGTDDERTDDRWVEDEIFGIGWAETEELPLGRTGASDGMPNIYATDPAKFLEAIGGKTSVDGQPSSEATDNNPATAGKTFSKNGADDEKLKVAPLSTGERSANNAATALFAALRGMLLPTGNYDMLDERTIRKIKRSAIVPGRAVLSENGRSLEINHSTTEGGRLRRSRVLIEPDKIKISVIFFSGFNGTATPPMKFEYAASPTDFVAGKDGRIYAVVPEGFLSDLAKANANLDQGEWQDALNLDYLPIGFVSNKDAVTASEEGPSHYGLAPNPEIPSAPVLPNQTIPSKIEGERPGISNVEPSGEKGWSQYSQNGTGENGLEVSSHLESDNAGRVEPVEHMPPSTEVISDGTLTMLDGAYESSDFGPIDSILRAIRLSIDAGKQIPTMPAERYWLMTNSNLYKGQDLRADKKGCVINGIFVSTTDRFHIESADTSNMTNILAHIKDESGRFIMDPKRGCIQVSGEISDADIEKLKSEAPGIRVVRVDTRDFKSDSEMDRDERQRCRFDLYDFMLNARRITAEDVAAQNGVYLVLATQIDAHNESGVATNEYINALVNGDLAFIIKYNLTYRPIMRYRVPEYHTIAATQMSA